jgi:hypothetical protein
VDRRPLNDRNASRRLMALAGAVVFGLLLWAIRSDWGGLRGPAPFPEWEWPFAPRSPAARHWVPLAWGLGLVACASLAGSAAARRQAGRMAILCLALASVLGVCFQLALLGVGEATPASILLRKSLRPASISYYNVAVSPLAEDALGFLDRHAELLPQLAYRAPHASTHPPGGVLYFRGVLGLLRALPESVSTAVVAATPLDPAIRESASSLLGDVEIATALVGVGLWPLLCVLTCWPIGLWVWKLTGDPLVAARAGVLWTLMPGPTLFVGSLEQLITPAVTLSTVGLGLAVSTGDTRRALAIATLAGLAGGVAVQLSYGAAVFLLTGAAVVLAPIALSTGSISAVLPRAMTAAGACGFVLLLPVAFGHEPVLALRTALDLHYALVTDARDYATWLVYNPIDVALFTGFPIAAFGLLRLMDAGARLRGRRALSSADWRLLALLGCCGLLLLFGVVRGEAGRLWMPLMPLALVCCTVVPPHPDGACGSRPGPAETIYLAGFLLAFILMLRMSWVL